MTMKRLSVLTVILLLAGALYGSTDPGCIGIDLGIEDNPSVKDALLPFRQINRPRIALALGGGGSRGLAQIGVLKVMERYALPVDAVAGTSMGAVIGGLLSVGYTAAELESLACSVDWDNIIHDMPARKQLFLGQKEQKERFLLQVRFRGLSPDLPGAYTSGQRMTDLLNELLLKAPLTAISDFELLPIPYAAVATDLLTGRKVVLKSGSMVEAMRSSMAIPLLFTPVSMDTLLLADGGLVQNLPVTEARSFGADLVLAINTSSKLRSAKSLNAPWEMADQVTTIMHQEKIKAQMDSADVVIEPDLRGIFNTDFGDVQGLIRAGEMAAESAMPDLLRLLDSLGSGDESVNELLPGGLPRGRRADANGISPANRGSPAASGERPPFKRFEVRDIRLAGIRRLDPVVIREKIGIDTLNPVSIPEIRWAGRSVFQTGYFETVSAILDTVRDMLVFEVAENPWIEGVSFRGNTVFPDSVLQGCIRIRPGVLNHQESRSAYRRLLQKYHDAGFSLASVRRTEIRDNRLFVEIDEGRISGVRLYGNHRTREFVINREFPVKSGDLFNLSAVQQGIASVYSTGYFETVRFDVKSRTHSHEVLLHMTEHPYTLARIGFRYDLDRQNKGIVELMEENLMGLGMEASLSGVAGTWDRAVEAAVRADRLFYSYFTGRLEAGAREQRFRLVEDAQDRGEYVISQGGVCLSAGQQMKRLGTLSARFCFEEVHVRPLSGLSLPSEKLTLSCLTVRSVVDSRDRLPFPTGGEYHVLEWETGLSFLGSDRPYFKLYSQMESHFSLLPRVVFQSQVRWGTADLTTPFSKQFRVGGLFSYMGLSESSWTGRRFFILSGQVRYRIPWFRRLEGWAVIRYDLGAMWGRYSRIVWEDFKQGLGAYIAWDTPIGPFYAGYGYMTDGMGRLYFSVGHPF
ncbi:patatin-like phospholipase family protein [bacterium]|nr:patatin-like phospholipase family protein [bacterium]